MIAYHWLREDMTAGSGDEPAWETGEERTVKTKTIALCERGYHSSPTLWDALEYIAGPVACIVDVDEPTANQKDEHKQVSKRRKLLVAVNVERELRQFAIDCATRALTRERDAGREPDPRSWAAIAAATDFLAGNITAEELAAAWDAARAAASAAAWDAARDAAWDAAWDAASAAASAAAWDAASAAASAAAWDAAWDAEREWQRERFNELVASKLILPLEALR